MVRSTVLPPSTSTLDGLPLDPEPHPAPPPLPELATHRLDEPFSHSSQLELQCGVSLQNNTNAIPPSATPNSSTGHILNYLNTLA
jgi:hypothetical protein